MYYTIDDHVEIFDIVGALDYCFDDADLYEDFDMYLNELYGGIVIGRENFAASVILYRLNEDLYFDIYNDYVDGLKDDSLNELRALTAEDYTYINGYRVYAWNEDEEEEELDEVNANEEENAHDEKYINPEAFQTAEDEQLAWAKANAAQEQTRAIDFGKLFGGRGI